MNEMRRVETPEEIAENTRIMNEVVLKDSFTIEKYYEVIRAMNDRWLSIMNHLEKYENGDNTYEQTFAPCQRQLSILALEMDRVSTRNIRQPGE